MLKFLLSKVFVRYRARIFLPDTIHPRSHKSNSTVVAKIFFATVQGLNRVAIKIKCNCCSLKVNSGHFRPSHLMLVKGVWPIEIMTDASN